MPERAILNPCLPAKPQNLVRHDHLTRNVVLCEQGNGIAVRPPLRNVET